MDILDYIDVTRRYIYAILLTTASCTLVAVGISLRMQPMYRAAVRLHIATVTAGSSEWIDFDLDYSDRLMNTYTQIATSGPVLDEVRKIIPPEHALPNIDAEVVPETELIVLTVEADDAGVAAETANNLADILIRQSSELAAHTGSRTRQALEKQIAQVDAALEQELAELEQLLNNSVTEDLESAAIGDIRQDIDANERLNQSLREQVTERAIRATILTTSLSVIEPAVRPLQPFRPNRVLIALLGLMIGAVGGVGLAFLLENLAQSSRSRHEASIVPSTADFSIVSALPAGGSNDQHLPRIANGDSGCEQHFFKTEAWHKVRDKVLFGVAAKLFHTLLVTSLERLDARRSLTIGVATSAAASGYNVVIVDCDSQIIDYANDQGLNDVVDGTCSLDEVIYLTMLPRITLVQLGLDIGDPARASDPATLEVALQQLDERFDLILLDAPALVGATLTASLASRIDGILLVQTPEPESEKIVDHVIDLLDGKGANLVASVTIQDIENVASMW